MSGGGRAELAGILSREDALALVLQVAHQARLHVEAVERLDRRASEAPKSSRLRAEMLADLHQRMSSHFTAWPLGYHAGTRVQPIDLKIFALLPRWARVLEDTVKTGEPVDGSMDALCRAAEEVGLGLGEAQRVMLTAQLKKSDPSDHHGAFTPLDAAKDASAVVFGRSRSTQAHTGAFIRSRVPEAKLASVVANWPNLLAYLVGDDLGHDRLQRIFIAAFIVGEVLGLTLTDIAPLLAPIPSGDAALGEGKEVGQGARGVRRRMRVKGMRLCRCRPRRVLDDRASAQATPHDAGDAS